MIYRNRCFYVLVPFDLNNNIMRREVCDAMEYAVVGTFRCVAAEGPASAAAPASALPAPAPAPGPALPVVVFDVGRSFALNCSVAASPGAAVVW